jgi:hypothetical protein
MKNSTISSVIAGGFFLAALLVVSVSTAGSPTVPNFNANTTSGYAPLTVLFTDTSTGSFPSVTYWFFSDNPDVRYDGLSVVHTFSSAGSYNVSHWAYGDGGGWINRTGFVTALNPVPAITTISPVKAPAGSPAFRLTVKGDGFRTGSIVQWNGANRTTRFISPMKLTAKIKARDVKKKGSFNVTVMNPAPGGGVTGVRKFRVT